MKDKTNLKSYESVEQLSGFATREMLVSYRNARIQRYQAQVEFLVSRSDKRPIAVIEIGSGSSALLYALAQKDMLAKGCGIELSKSRHLFAEEWKKDDGYPMVENINRNFAEVHPGKIQWDWFVVIDNTFTYLYPEDNSYPAMLLKMAWESLKSDGRIILDFINYAKRDERFEYRQWTKFPPGDPYGYGLYSNKIEDGINRSESTFLKKDGTEAAKVDLSKVYSLSQITELLVSFNFTVEEVFATFDGEPYDELQSERLVVTARKIVKQLQ